MKRIATLGLLLGVVTLLSAGCGSSPNANTAKIDAIIRQYNIDASTLNYSGMANLSVNPIRGVLQHMAGQFGSKPEKNIQVTNESIDILQDTGTEATVETAYDFGPKGASSSSLKHVDIIFKLSKQSGEWIVDDIYLSMSNPQG